MNKAIERSCEAAGTSARCAQLQRLPSVVAMRPLAPRLHSHSAHTQQQHQRSISSKLGVAAPVRLGDCLTTEEECVAERQQSVKAVSSQSPDELLKDVLSPVAEDMETMRQNLKNVVGSRHPMLMAAAEQIFSAGEGDMGLLSPPWGRSAPAWAPSSPAAQSF
jgi:hypothetical protein